MERLYSTGEPAELVQYDWYHGNISKEQAEVILVKGSGNVFLVRKQSSNLVLSKSIRGWISHDLIKRGPEGYHLEGRQAFRSVSDLVRYYQQRPLNEKDGQVLGEAADKKLHTGNDDNTCTRTRLK